MNALRFALLCLSVSLSGCLCGVGAMTEPDGGPGPSTGDGAVTFDAGGMDAGAPPELEAAVVDLTGNLWALALDGGARLLVDWQDAGANGFLRSPRWQPNGSTLAFADGERPWLLEAGGRPRRLDLAVTATTPYQGSTTRVEWSFDGTRLAFDSVAPNDDPTVFLLPTDGGREPLSVGTAGRWAWTGDGRSILFSDYDPGRQTNLTWDYRLAEADAGELSTGLLIDSSRAGLTVLEQAVAMPDGGVEIAIVARTSGGATFEVLPRDTVSVTRNRLGGVFNPAGTELVVKGTDSQGLSLKVLRVRLDGGTLGLYDRPTEDPDFPVCLRYLPDGERLSFVTAETPPSLVLSFPDGGVTRLLTPALRSPAQLGCLDWHLRRD